MDTSEAGEGTGPPEEGGEVERLAEVIAGFRRWETVQEYHRRMAAVILAAGYHLAAAAVPGPERNSSPDEH